MQGSVFLRLSKCGLLGIVEVVEDRSHHSPAFFAPPADPEPRPNPEAAAIVAIRQAVREHLQNVEGY